MIVDVDVDVDVIVDLDGDGDEAVDDTSAILGQPREHRNGALEKLGRAVAVAVAVAVNVK